MNKKYEMIMFDLGGILVELGENPFPPEWFQDNMIQSKEWLHHPVALAFEKGEISPKEFANMVKDKYNLKQEIDEILFEFSRWIKGNYDHVEEVLTKLREKYTLCILSNTNEVHWPILMKDFRLEELVDYPFASHLIGLAKPDQAIYKYIMEQTEFESEKILFFDDNIKNIESAISLGIDAIHCKGFAEVKKYLEESGVLDRIIG